MNNSISGKNIVNNDGVKSASSLFSARPGSPQGGVSGFDDIFSEVKKRLSGQLDAAASGNALPPDALCVIPLSPNINVLTQKNPEFSEDTIRQFAVGEGLNPDMLRMIMGNTAPTLGVPTPTLGAPLPGNAVKASLLQAVASALPVGSGAAFSMGAGTLALRAALVPPAAEMPQALPQDMARLIMQGAGPGIAAKPAAASMAPAGLGLGVSGGERYAAADLMPTVADGAAVSVAALAGVQAALRGSAPQPVDMATRGALNPLAQAAPEASLAHLSVSYNPVATPAAVSTVIPVAADPAMEVLAAVRAQPETALQTSAPIAQTPLQAPTQKSEVMLGSGAFMQVALASEQGAATKIAENAAITQALGELALKAGLAERKTTAGILAERGAIHDLDAAVGIAAVELPAQAMQVGAVWHEEIDLSRLAPAQADSRDPAASSRGVNGQDADAKSPENAMLRDKLYQQQQYQKLSDQMMDVVGRRISDQVAKGVWQMSFQLRPARLGRIDVQLGMSDGAVDATFSASQTGTQQLLDGGLDRLKGALESAGVNVGRLATDSNAPQGGGQQGPASGESGGRSAGRATSPSTTPVVLTTAAESRLSADGVDLFV